MQSSKPIKKSSFHLFLGVEQTRSPSQSSPWGILCKKRNRRQTPPGPHQHPEFLSPRESQDLQRKNSSTVNDIRRLFEHLFSDVALTSLYFNKWSSWSSLKGIEGRVILNAVIPSSYQFVLSAIILSLESLGKLAILLQVLEQQLQFRRWSNMALKYMYKELSLDGFNWSNTWLGFFNKLPRDSQLEREFFFIFIDKVDKYFFIWL